MATSGITSLDLTAREIVSGAMEDSAIISLGVDPTAEEMDACIRRLNLMLKSWSVKANLWRETSTTETILAGTGSVALDADVQEVINVRFVQAATNHRQLYQWTREQYYSMPNRTSAGNPTIFFVERAVSGLALKVWPVPAANITVEIDYTRAAEVVTDPGQTMDFGLDYLEAIQTNLALRCAAIFGVEPSAELIARAQRLEREMFDADRPDSYFMESDCA